MRPTVIRLAATFALLVGAPSAAQAADFSISGHYQYGVSVNGSALPSYYASAVGGRLGFSFDNNLYLGAVADFYLGESSSFEGLDVDLSSYNLFAEVGYNFNLPGLPLTIRPRIGAGYLSLSSPDNLATFGLTDGTFAVTPGVSLRYSLISALFIGAEAQMVIPTEQLEQIEKAVSLGASVGLSF